MQPTAHALYSVAQVREAERIAIEELQMPGLQLMRSAGLAAFNALKQRWPDARRLSVYCGCGNNAGDGYVVARLAKDAGYIVSVFSMTDPDNLAGDALTVCRDYLSAGGKVAPFDSGAKADGVVVDALLGTGLNRELAPDYAEAIALINRSGRPVLALDVPSGLHADSGCVLGCAVRADLTVTFIALKAGLFTGDAAGYCGDIVCSSLNVPDSVLSKLKVTARFLTKTALAPRPRSAHKGHFGHVLVVGGNLGYSGAVRLAGEAALRCGAGLVSIATRVEHSSFLHLGRPELMCHGIERSAQLKPLLDKASVIVIGPGLGQDAWAQDLLSAALAGDKICIADADALNLLAKHPQKRGDWVITPHPGEAA
ncbi:MAG: NAD(P)H-hydrate epimerase, partial [Methylomonas sp.]|nr:NAD(P)H-hydrate epimerase [Methylomonas sp.]